MKRCPFCGGAGDMRTDSKGYWIECTLCDARSGIIHAYRPESASSIRDEVRKRWNKRVDKKVSSRKLTQPFYPGFGAKAKRLKMNAEKLKHKLTRWDAHYSQSKE